MEKQLLNERPLYIMDNQEDILYHDNVVETNYKWFAFTKRVMVFNKTMQWLDSNDDCILCFSDAGNLLLTGTDQASKWQVNPPDETSSDGVYDRYIKKSDSHTGYMVLPSFQFHMGQHPYVEIEVSEANRDWQVCVFFKGRSGIPLLCSGWKQGPAKVCLNIATELRKIGFQKQFAELNFVIGVWDPEPSGDCGVTFNMIMPGQAAIISCLPVIRTAQHAKDGVPIVATVTGGDGKFISDERVQVFADWKNEKIALTRAIRQGIWQRTTKQH